MIVKSVNFSAKKQTSMATAKPFRFQGKSNVLVKSCGNTHHLAKAK